MTAEPRAASWRVRPMHPADIAEVIALAAGEPTAPHWPLFEYQRMLEVIALAPDRRHAWVLADLPEDSGPGEGQAGSVLAGFAMAGLVAGICDLEAVVVRAAWRGQGLGGRLVEAAAAWARTHRAFRMQLEVRPSNTAAVRLYSRLGFTRDGARPKYYRNPEEDALLMSLALEPTA